MLAAIRAATRQIGHSLHRSAGARRPALALGRGERCTAAQVPARQGSAPRAPERIRKNSNSSIGYREYKAETISAQRGRAAAAARQEARNLSRT